MAKKNIRKPASPTRLPSPERRTVRATTRKSATPPDAAIAESAGSPAGALTADDTRRAVDDNPATHAPTYDQIAEAAYRRYLERGGGHGRDFDDWLDAERSLRPRA